MFGFFNQGFQNQDDFFYLHCLAQTAKFAPNGRIVCSLISKWSLATQANIFDGDLQRGAASFGPYPVLLEVFSTGTVATSYEEILSRVDVRDDEGNVIGQTENITNNKIETEFVDRVEYRLSFQGRLWCQFFVLGDSYAVQNVDPTIDCPLFHTTVHGGWFSRTTFRTSTKPGVDPALAILIAQLCATEFSVAGVKANLNAQTPAYPPMSILPNFLPTAYSPYNPEPLNAGQPVTFVF